MVNKNVFFLLMAIFAVYVGVDASIPDFTNCTPASNAQIQDISLIQNGVSCPSSPCTLTKGIPFNAVVNTIPTSQSDSLTLTVKFTLFGFTVGTTTDPNGCTSLGATCPVAANAIATFTYSNTVPESTPPGQYLVELHIANQVGDIVCAKVEVKV